MTSRTSRITNKLGSLALGALVTAAMLTGPAIINTARAQDSGALLNALVKKGILTDQDAEELRADLSKDSAASVIETVSSGKSTSGLQFSGRLQMQYVNVATTDDNDTPAATSGAGLNYNRLSRGFMRRFYVGVKGNLGANWSANFNYDFADGGSWDKATINWTGLLGSQPFSFDIGLRKVNFAYEETTSSGSLKAIERSGVTRYFVEDANGRRLGAGSYRIGLFADYNPNAAAGKATGLFAGAALTNAERQSKVSEVSLQDNTVVFGSQPAVWLNGGYSGKAGSLTYIVGASGGYLPRMGGLRGSNQAYTLGASITEGDFYADITYGAFNFVADYLIAGVDKGNQNGTTATISGFWVQPSYKISDKWEVVARYSLTSTDGRGVRVSDGVRSSLANVSGKNLNEYYIGANYYIIGNDLKWQFGYIGGQTSGALLNAAAPLNKETANGFRTQIQINF